MSQPTSKRNTLRSKILIKKEKWITDQTTNQQMALAGCRTQIGCLAENDTSLSAMNIMHQEHVYGRNKRNLPIIINIIRRHKGRVDKKSRLENRK